MKKFVYVFAGLSVLASTAFADVTVTDLEHHWVCTTNSTAPATDDQMAKMQKSAADAFAYATQHCGDCTKITCEVQTTASTTTTTPETTPATIPATTE